MGWIVGYEQTTESIERQAVRSAERASTVYANSRMKDLQKCYFFLKISTIQKMNQMQPKHMKKKGMMLAANASMDTLSITFGQLQFYPIVEIVIHTLQSVWRRHPGVFIHSLFHHVVVHA